MQAWKLTYSNSKDPGQRFIAGICSNSREEAVNAIKRFVNFPYNVERTEFLGDIQAMSLEVEKKVAEYYYRNNPPKSTDKPEAPAMAAQELYMSGNQTSPPQEEKDVEAALDEAVSNSQEVECQYCGKVLKGPAALQAHESKCEHNPDKASKEMPCRYCGRLCKGANALSYHEKRCPNNNNKSK